MIVKLLIEHHLEFLSLKGGRRGLSESTLVKKSNCWKSHAMAQMILNTELLTQCKMRTSNLLIKASKISLGGYTQ